MSQSSPTIGWHMHQLSTDSQYPVIDLAPHQFGVFSMKID